MTALYQVQQDSYQAAGDYHQALGLHFASLHPDNHGHNLAATRAHVLAEADRYRQALITLLERLFTADIRERDDEATQRTQRLIELLDIETQLIRKEGNSPINAMPDPHTEAKIDELAQKILATVDAHRVLHPALSWTDALEAINQAYCIASDIQDAAEPNPS